MIDFNNFRKTKIVCTLGPASNNRDTIKQLLMAGANIFRLNLNYGTLQEHAETINIIRSISGESGISAGILLDCPGLKKYPDMPIEKAFGEHISFGAECKVDFIALSFISTADQVQRVREFTAKKHIDIPLVVKIEQAGALNDIKGIIAAADAIMVARGDLAIQINIEKIPVAQKKIIQAANEAGKPVITATQMLESMVRNPSPTRAEATDVANAILDGTDALMLSEESAMGKYPVQAVETMNRIALETEKNYYKYSPTEKLSKDGDGKKVDDATSHAACHIAHQLNARSIIAFTTGGTTALRLSSYRPMPPVIAITTNQKIVNRLSIAWGVHTVIKETPEHIGHVFKMANDTAKEHGMRKGELIVLTAGLPLAQPGSTNLVKVHEVE